MNKISAILRRKYVWVIAGAVLLVGAIFLFRNGNGEEATLTVTRADFINQVSVSGKVITASEADLGFASSGRIGRIAVRSGDSVRAGAMLAQLEIGDLLADLKIKQIGSQTSSISLEDARENVEKVTTQENTKVESAYRALLTEDLELTPNSISYTVAAPEVSGIYDGKEGTYKVRITQDDVTNPDLTLRTFDLENTEREIDEEKPTPLGTRGLFISFPDEPDSYQDTTWFLEIPNKSGASYLANYNAYNEAKKERDLAIKNAEFEYQKLLTEKNDGVSSVAQAEIDKIRAEIKKSTIYAPFEGVVTDVAKETGETASSNEAVVSMIGTGTFQIESFVPEVNIALVELGHVAEVTLDAYGEKEVFSATVISIDPAETTRDGVSTYKVVLQFQEADPRIKAGMTANVSVIIFKKPAAIAVPGGVVFEEGGKNYVEVKRDNAIEKREVVVGEVSSLGQVEIVSGLEEGEEIVLTPKATAVE